MVLIRSQCHFLAPYVLSKYNLKLKLYFLCGDSNLLVQVSTP